MESQQVNIVVYFSSIFRFYVIFKINLICCISARIRNWMPLLFVSVKMMLLDIQHSKSSLFSLKYRFESNYMHCW